MFTLFIVEVSTNAIIQPDTKRILLHIFFYISNSVRNFFRCGGGGTYCLSISVCLGSFCSRLHNFQFSILCPFLNILRSRTPSLFRTNIFCVPRNFDNYLAVSKLWVVSSGRASEGGAVCKPPPICSALPVTGGTTSQSSSLSGSWSSSSSCSWETRS